MSRHQIRGRDPAHKVIVGWDSPLRTYFAQVIDRKKEDADPDEKFVTWIGCSSEEILEVDDLRNRIKPWAYIGADVAAKLRGDRYVGR